MKPLKRSLRGAIVAVLVGVILPSSPAAAGENMDTDLGMVLGHLGFSPYNAQQVIDRSLEVTPTLFKSAPSLDPPSIDPSEAPWGVPARIGVTWVTWPDASAVPSFPDSPQVVDDLLYLPHGGPTPGATYALMWAQMEGPIPIDDSMELFQNWSFPFMLAGADTWMPYEEYPFDTWAGASRIPYVTYGPDPWALNLAVVEGDSIMDVDFDGFGLIGYDSIVVAVDVDTLFPDGYEGSTYGFAGHIHDGRYGLTTDSRSMVSFATGEPGLLVSVPVTDTIEVGSEPPTSSSSSSSSSTSSSSSSTSSSLASAEPPPAAAPPEEEEDTGGFPVTGVLFLVGGLVLVGVGGKLFFAKKGDPCTDLLLAWEAARRACEEARAEAAAAEDACDKARAHHRDLKRQHRNICKEWPPACEGEGAWIEESGKPDSRITQRDLHARRLVLGPLWDDYQAGKVSAEEVERVWQRADTPEFRQELRKRTEAKKAEREALGAEIGTAAAAEAKACAASAEARAKADAACQKAEEAKAAYEACVKEHNARAFVDAVMRLGEEEGGAGDGGEPAEPSPTPGGPATTVPSDPLAGRKVGVSVPFEIDKTGLSGPELERARRLERIFRMRKGTGDIAAVALDLYQFDQWHQETFGEPWFSWSAEGGRPDSVTSTAGYTDRFMQTRVMACYEFVHFCAYIASDQLGSQRVGGDDDHPVLEDAYSVSWGFPDEVSTNTTTLDGDAARGSVLTGVYRWNADYNNSAGYFHTGISIGDGKIVSLGSDGLELEDATGTVGGCFPSVGYSEVQVGDYRYGRLNPAPTGSQ